MRRGMDREPIAAVKDKAHWLTERVEAALESGEIDEAEWHRQVAEVITPAYLAADTPWGQSGKMGDEDGWNYARSLICDAIDGDGSFLDVGCANGFLMECMKRWAVERGLRVQPYGLDISPELVELARERLPNWAGRIYTGNVMTWRAAQRFDFVRTGLEYAPSRRRRDLARRILDDLVAEGGRLIVGTYHGEGVGPDSLEREMESWGFAVAGHTSRPHRDDRLVYRVLWIDA